MRRINKAGSIVAASSLLMLGAMSGAHAQSGYAMQDLGVRGDVSVTGLNNSGEIVGIAYTSQGNIPYLYSNGNAQNLTRLPTGDKIVYVGGINDSGIITGAATLVNGKSDAMLYNSRTGAIQLLGSPPGSSSSGEDINNAGHVAGSIGYNNQYAHAMLYKGGQVTDLGTLPTSAGQTSVSRAINSRDQVVGESHVGTGADSHAFLYDGGQMHDLGTLLGGFDSQANAINDNGDIVGTSNGYGTNGKPVYDAFLYHNGVMQDLGNFGGRISVAFGINNAGTIVGQASDTNFNDLPFVYTGGQMHSLFDLIPDGANWSGGTAYAINEQGQIAGVASHNGVRTLFLATPVKATPSPGALWTAGLGAGMLVMRLRRKRA